MQHSTRSNRVLYELCSDSQNIFNGVRFFCCTTNHMGKYTMSRLISLFATAAGKGQQRWLVALILLIVASAPAPAADVRSAPQTYFMLVFNEPVAGKEDEYNQWYDQQHAPDVVAVPGFVSAQRFIYNSSVQWREAALKKPRYLVLYTISTDDLPAVIAEVKRRLSTGQTRISTALDPKSGQMYFYRAFRPRVPGVGGQPADAQPGPMQTYYQIVFGDATAGKDDEFNTWYDQDHVPALVAAPGFRFAQRTVISDVQMLPIENPSRYLVLFEIVTSDLPAVFRYKMRGSDPPPAFNRERTFGYTYRAIGPLLVGDEIRAARAKQSR